jgi:DNA invertase Pin-like site-specific DNA recombinase
MAGQLIGYARVSTDAQDVTAQRDGLMALGVGADRIYVDPGLTGRNRDRPALREALAACWEGDTFVVTKLDRLGRSMVDLRNIGAELTAKGAVMSIGGSLHDPTDPLRNFLFNSLAMFAEFESDMISARTKEGMKVAAKKGKLKGGKPKLSRAAEKHLVALHRAGDHSISELCDLFSIGRATVYRALDRNPIEHDGQVTLPRVDDVNA